MNHKHTMTIYDSYQTYAVCHECGLHDWYEKDDMLGVESMKKKYPKAKLVDVMEEIRRESQNY